MRTIEILYMGHLVHNVTSRLQVTSHGSEPGSFARRADMHANSSWIDRNMPTASGLPRT